MRRWLFVCAIANFCVSPAALGQGISCTPNEDPMLMSTLQFQSFNYAQKGNYKAACKLLDKIQNLLEKRIELFGECGGAALEVQTEALLDSNAGLKKSYGCAQ